MVDEVISYLYYKVSRKAGSSMLTSPAFLQKERTAHAWPYFHHLKIKPF